MPILRSGYAPLLAIGFTTLALGPQACGSSDSTKTKPGAGGSAGTGGAGGRTGGTGGAASGMAGAGESGQGGDSSALRCGTATCSAVEVADFTLPACCPANTRNRCGYDVSEAAASLGLEAACVATDQSGSDDPSCENVDAPSGLPGVPAIFPGCCTPSGLCGARVDVKDAFGIDFGCVEVSGLVNGGTSRGCGAGGAGGEGGTGVGGNGGESDGGESSGGEGGAPTVCGGSSLGLVAHYRGDGNTTDSSGRGHGGVFVPGSGGPLTYAAGSIDQAFNFSGTGHLEIAEAADLDVKVGVTLSAWIRSDAGAGTHRDIVGKDGEGYTNGVGSPFERQYFLIISDLNRLRGHVGTADGLSVLDGATTVSPGTWIHAAMTYDAETGELKLYRDGTPDGSLIVSGDRCVIDTPQPLRIGGGAPPQYDQLHFTGLIDDVRVYDRALSAADIAALP